ncbi:MAG: SpoIIE family protein phosphatase [Flavobacteriales bacterium]|nr:SpoIIE family protein phosphatase [Flavobacteriales bacterium]
MRRYLARILILFAWMAGLVPHYATAQSANFKSFSVEDGLIQSQVRALEQDKDGNLWIGTVGGLSRYNGKKFENFTRKDGLAEDWITASCLDENDNLWLGHWGGGITFYDRKSGEFQDLQFEKYSKYKPITAMVSDGNGNIWVGAENTGLFKISGASGEVISLDGLQSNQVASLVMDQNQRLWVGTGKGLCCVDAASGKVKQCLSEENGFPHGTIQTMVLYAGHELWFSGKDMGLWRADLRIPIPSSSPSESGFLTEQLTKEGGRFPDIRVLFADKDDKVWVATEDAGVLQFIPVSEPGSSGFIKGEVHPFGNKVEMKYYQANVFLVDRESNVWMGSDIGLNLYKGELLQLYNHNDNLPNNMIWSVLNDTRGNVWMGSNEGITKMSFPRTPSGKALYYSPQVTTYGVANGLEDPVVLSVFEDKQGFIWIGTDHGGVYRMNPADEKIERIKQLDAWGVAPVFSIRDDRNGHIWFATSAGALSLDPTSGQAIRYTSDDGLGGDKVYGLFKDSSGNLWMGILGGYLTRYDGSSFKQYGETEGLNQKFILGFTEDKQGNIWMISYGGGIYSFDGTTFKQITTSEGLGSDSPTFLMADGQGNLWIGHNHGIEKYMPETGTFVRYGKRQGYINIETNLNAVSKDRSGNIWFGTIRGAVKLDPGSDKANKVPPVTSIDGLKIFQKDATFPADSLFPYESNHLTFTFTGVSLANPDQVTYQVMLEGFDKDWLPAQAADYITYSGLNPGRYTLKVKAANRDGVWNETPVSYTFSVEAPFWMTWWFLALCVVLLALLIFGFVKVRERRLKAQKAILERQVTERTTELRQEKEKVEKQSSEISHKNQQITDSINYARRIQTAILPSLDSIRSKLPDTFVFFKPKDIVSGDFYWVDQVGDKILVAVVDCTGHGVPGAFMSLIGHNLIDKIVHEFHQTQPADILHSLSKEVARSLKQERDHAEVKDGMDIALCAIDLKKMELTFAGSYNPLYLIRNGQLKEMKGDRIPIGKRTVSADARFNNQTEKLMAGDQLYLFSDGFADQKGGEQKKKFYYPPFKQLLLDHAHLPMAEQSKVLEDTMSDWKRNVEQIDDMLVFGIRIGTKQ